MSQKEQTKEKLSQLREQVSFGGEEVDTPIGETDGDLPAELKEAAIEEVREAISEELDGTLPGELGEALLDGIDIEDLDPDRLGAIGEAIGRSLGGTAGRRVGELLGEWIEELFETDDDAVLDSIAEQLDSGNESDGGEGDDETESNGDDSGGDLEGMPTEDLQSLADDLMDELDERTGS